MCLGIDYMHSHNIIHRDINAENIFFHNNMVKITNFSWSSKAQNRNKSLSQTLAKISAEDFSSKLIDKKIDVRCLGVLTFELVFCKTQSSGT